MSFNLTTIPPKQNGEIRLYSMKFCPYVQRVLIVLLAKRIPHEIVYVNLQNKPEWLFDLHPQGKVPALDIGSKVLVESLDIADYLDETYPEPPLYPKDPEAKARDKELIRKFDDLTKAFYAIVFNKDGKALREYVDELLPLLEPFEDELSKRGTYFGGDRPGMVDYMIWPWVERSAIIKLRHGEELPLPYEKIRRVRTWCAKLREEEAVARTVIEPERHLKLIQAFIKPGTVLDYDDI